MKRKRKLICMQCNMWWILEQQTLTTIEAWTYCKAWIIQLPRKSSSVLRGDTAQGHVELVWDTDDSTDDKYSMWFIVSQSCIVKGHKQQTWWVYTRTVNTSYILFTQDSYSFNSLFYLYSRQKPMLLNFTMNLFNEFSDYIIHHKEVLLAETEV